MTLSDPRDDAPCVHETDLYDGWTDVYEVEPPLIRLTRECPDCGTCETYTLEPDPDSDFMLYFTKLKMQRSRGDIADVSLQIVEEMTDGIDAYAHLTIERGEGSGVEVVSDEPYYFFY